MALNSSDVLLISRAGTLYKILGSDILNFIQNNIGTSEYQVANIAARNALIAGAPGNGLSVGDRVFVTDATADGTVSTGWAIYVYMGSSTWTKAAEQEGLDVVAGGNTDLSYTAGASQGIVVSSSGNDATIPSVDATNAGLMLPAHKTKVDFITVTGATDLDAIRTASHAAASAARTAASNPVKVSAGQVLDLDIASLTTAP